MDRKYSLKSIKTINTVIESTPLLVSSSKGNFQGHTLVHYSLIQLAVVGSKDSLFESSTLATPWLSHRTQNEVGSVPSIKII